MCLHPAHFRRNDKLHSCSISLLKMVNDGTSLLYMMCRSTSADLRGAKQLVYSVQSHKFIFYCKKTPKIKKQKTKTINQNQATTNQSKKTPKHNQKPLNSMYGAVPTRNLLTLLKFSYAGCLNFSIFCLTISKEIIDFAT